MRIINTILFTVIVLQTSCYTVHLETRKDNPIEQLEYKYAVRLDAIWTTKRAQAILDILEAISPNPDLNVTASTWKVSDEDVQNDIHIKSQEGLKTVTISSDVFPRQEAKENSVPDKRLFYAVVQFITENGTNRSAIKFILQERYGIGIEVSSYESLFNRRPKDEGARLTDFENEDLMIFISILEKFPQALHKMPQLKYVICRADDSFDVLGRAWSTLNFIEFAESFFRERNFDRICKTIAHEKAHFLWHHLFPEQLKNDWQQLGGWYENPENEEGWSTDKDRKGFVSDYAYEKNPNEDMAESLAYYLVYPDRLRDCCMEKYNFIHNRIMLTYGERYISPNRM